MTPSHDDALSKLIALARQEDLGDGDLTTSLMPEADVPAAFDIVAKQEGVLAGRQIAEKVLAAFDPHLTIHWSGWAEDGRDICGTPKSLATVNGSLRSILSAERVFLNFLQRLCGVATATRHFVQAVSGTQAQILDTRKTVPGWRSLDKYAVRCGGGRNHREGLFDAVLIKDNHLAGVPIERLAGRVFEMLNAMGSLSRKPAFVEVEAASLAQMRELCNVVGIDVILLDNFAVSELAAAVAYRDSMGLGRRVELEASGGVNLQSVRAIAETGVERISVGAITHSAAALDLSLERL